MTSNLRYILSLILGTFEVKEVHGCNINNLIYVYFYFAYYIIVIENKTFIYVIS